MSKFVGPTKKMMEALENEGLNVTWPKTIESEGDLALEGTFTTGPDWEKCVTIDLRNEGALKTKQDVDAAICRQLEEAWEAFDVDEELSLNLQGTAEEREARGVPKAARLLEDMQEQETFLKRLFDVADTVCHDRPIHSAEKHEDQIHITKQTADNICTLLISAYPRFKAKISRLDTVEIVDELRKKCGKPTEKWDFAK